MIRRMYYGDGAPSASASTSEDLPLPTKPPSVSACPNQDSLRHPDETPASSIWASNAMQAQARAYVEAAAANPRDLAVLSAVAAFAITLPYTSTPETSPFAFASASESVSAPSASHTLTTPFDTYGVLQVGNAVVQENARHYAVTFSVEMDAAATDKAIADAQSGARPPSYSRDVGGEEGAPTTDGILAYTRQMLGTRMRPTVSFDLLRRFQELNLAIPSEAIMSTAFVVEEDALRLCVRILQADATPADRWAVRVVDAEEAGRMKPRPEVPEDWTQMSMLLQTGDVDAGLEAVVGEIDHAFPNVVRELDQIPVAAGVECLRRIIRESMAREGVALAQGKEGEEGGVPDDSSVYNVLGIRFRVSVVSSAGYRGYKVAATAPAYKVTWDDVRSLHATLLDLGVGVDRFEVVLPSVEDYSGASMMPYGGGEENRDTRVWMSLTIPHTVSGGMVSSKPDQSTDCGVICAFHPHPTQPCFMRCTRCVMGARKSVHVLMSPMPTRISSPAHVWAESIRGRLFGDALVQGADAARTEGGGYKSKLRAGGRGGVGGGRGGRARFTPFGTVNG